MFDKFSSNNSFIEPIPCEYGVDDWQQLLNTFLHLPKAFGSADCNTFIYD